MFDIINIIIYLLPFCTCLIWFKTIERNDALLSFSCLFLALKYFSYFELVGLYGRYYVILINVGKRVFFFLLLFVLIMIMSFAFAFYILLSPKLSYSLDELTINDDPNNPWNLAPTYQAFRNENDINSTLFIIQNSDNNTNMFASPGTAIFATFLLFTGIIYLMNTYQQIKLINHFSINLLFIGDTSAFSNWQYRNNWALVFLIILFISITVIFILNVFIGLFSEAMKFDVDASVSMMDAEV